MNNTCFVIMPIGKNEKFKYWKAIYDFIKPIVKEHYTCLRADESYGPGNIIHEIIHHLKESSVVVADLTGRNPNVFYELGIRHSFSNRTILLSQDSDIPFDIGFLRTIIYDFKTETGRKKLKNDLDGHLRAVKENPDKIDNPVFEYLRTHWEEIDEAILNSKEIDEGLEKERARLLSQDYQTEFFKIISGKDEFELLELLRTKKNIDDLMAHLGISKISEGVFESPYSNMRFSYNNDDYQKFRFKYIR